MNEPDAATPPQRPRAARLAFAFLRIALLIYAGVAVILWWFQERLIFPGQSSKGQGWAEVTPGPREELVRLALPGGEQIVALFGQALGTPGGAPLDPKASPTILFFYGNGQCLQTARDHFEFLRRLGANVLIPEYPGYGMSEGCPGEQQFVLAAHAALDHLLQRKDIDPHRIVVGGLSIGGAVAFQVASRPEVAGAFTLNTFSSLTEISQRRYPFLPIRLLLRHPFDSRAAIARVSCPILIGHGDSDGLVPPAMADELAKSAGGPVTQFSIPGADHNEAFSRDPALVRDAISDWLATLRTATR